MVGHRIASLLKASPEGEGFHPSQTGTLSISGDYVRTIDYKIRNDRIGAKIASAVVEWAGKIWLFTLGPMGVRSSGGTLVAEIGPVPDVPAAASYVLDVNEADFGPEMKEQVAQQVHTHPGPEIFYLLTGEQCLETPNGTTRARAGEGMVAPAHTPMQLNIMGSSKRDAFFVVVRDATKPRVTPSDWQPTGTCK
jgi:mannose-6-phosphate isomerase-like protein (cupin superfamily)